MSADSDVCIACKCRFDVNGRRFCSECEAGPFCPFCLALRHRHEHGWLRRLTRLLGLHRCVQCTEVAR